MKVKVLDFTREMPTFCEIFERRNLCAHTDLVVSKRYITNCLKYGLKEDEIQKIDKKINVDPKYLSETTAIIVEYGIIISHIIWRAIFKSDEEQIAAADKLLLAHAAMISRSGRHELAERLLFLGYCKFKPSSDLLKREMIIGRAKALIMLDKLDDAQKIINEHDWTSSNTRMRIYRQAILGEEAGIEDLIKISKMENSITLDEYASSPAFSNLSLSPTFSSMLRSVFGAADQAGADLKSIFHNMYPDGDNNPAGKAAVKQKLPTNGRSSKIDIDAEAIVDASNKIMEAKLKVTARRSRKSSGNKG
ncbi:hypothetical protein [Methylobacterium phyllostachyos]|uniref:hypothetical protein n=1 Tax=Methylobacterium phyllostachyos TaxID=582672 RepID=UPI00115FD71F|nr:hypothetical protein [Methylobacterium phyllostachyos]